MKFLFLLLLPLFAFAETKLLLVGGGKRPVEAMRRFVAHAGTKNLILVIPWASESMEGGDNIKKDLVALGATKVEVVSMHGDLYFKEKLAEANGVFFTGGDQNKLMRSIRHFEVKESFIERFNQDVIFAGTSAGTAIMSNPMLTGKDSELAEGLGLLPKNYIVDQHFIVRNRWLRLANIVSNSGLIGIGVDEDNALLVEGNRAEVIGPTQVQLLFKHGSTVETMSFANSEAFEIE